MIRDSFFRNPFHGLLVLSGVAFVVTACAASLIFADAARGRSRLVRSPFVRYFEQDGVRLMTWELGVLAICALGAVATEPFWQRRAGRRPQVARPAQPPAPVTAPAPAIPPAPAHTGVPQTGERPLSLASPPQDEPGR